MREYIKREIIIETERECRRKQGKELRGKEIIKGGKEKNKIRTEEKCEEGNKRRNERREESTDLHKTCALFKRKLVRTLIIFV
jgi:hypothetical protein